MKHGTGVAALCLGSLVAAQSVVAGTLITGNPYSESRGADMPIAVFLPACSDALNGKIYVFGGHVGAETLTDAIQVYDITTDSWRLAAGKMPYPTRGGPNTTAIWGGKIYISPNLGPTYNGGWGQRERIVEFDPVTESAAERASFGATVWAVSPVALGDHIYWFGACGIGEEHKIWRYDPVANVVTHACNLVGIGRDTNANIGSDGRVYCFGGQRGGAERTAIDVYDPVTNVCALAPAALPRPASPFVWPGPGDLVYMIKPHPMDTYNLSLTAYSVNQGLIEESPYTYSFRDTELMGNAHDPATGKVYFFGGMQSTNWGTPLPATYILEAPGEPLLSILSIGPREGPCCSQGIVTGRGFGQAGGAVKFTPDSGSETDWDVLSWSDTEIAFRVPAGTPSGSGTVRIVRSDQEESSEVDFDVTQPVTICIDARNTAGIDNGGEQHPFNTLEEGLGAASDGATVKVARGTYLEDIVFDGKRLTIQGGYAGGMYPGTGDFDEANRNPSPETNQTVIDGSGSATQVVCQDAAARGSVLTGLTIRNGGAIFGGGVVLRRVIARSGTP